MPVNDDVRCPLCAGRGIYRVDAFKRHRAFEGFCPLCRGTRHVSSTEHSWFVSVQRQMHRVADAMQAGDADRAYREARIAGGVARALLSQ
jgi:excinuclease UvrABC ATPase subunit